MVLILVMIDNVYVHNHGKLYNNQLNFGKMLTCLLANKIIIKLKCKLMYWYIIV
jgi:hypothetical protein